MSNILLNGEQMMKATFDLLKVVKPMIDARSQMLADAVASRRPRCHEDYPVAWADALRKTCISCGSATQPCCGH